MIKVMIGFNRKPGVDIQPTLHKLKSFAMTFQGFLGIESLESEEGSPIVVLLFNWESSDDWNVWKASHIRKQILDGAQALLLDEPKVTAYKVVPFSGWPSEGLVP